MTYFSLSKLSQPGSYRFVGQFACEDFEYETAPDKKELAPDHYISFATRRRPVKNPKSNKPLRGYEEGR